jgi:ribonuclease Z
VVLTEVVAGPFSIKGISVGGVYTALHVPELGVMFDVGAAPRSFAAADDLLLSHGHADHIGALTALLGLRGLMRRGPLRLFMPAAIVDHVMEAVATMSKLQRYELTVEPVAMVAGDEQHLRNDLWVRAFPTFHPVPSLGYQILRRVNKLRPELADLPGPQIAARRKAGEDVHVVSERLELAYATDTLLRVIDETPSILRSRVLVMECSFLDDRKDLESSRAGCHIHLDELLARAAEFDNEHLVLMHFSQIYSPREVHAILGARLPASLAERVIVFAPERGPWPG